MNNYEALNFFAKLSSTMENDPISIKLSPKSDFTDVDAKFILNYADKSTSILDIGTGTGLIINKIYDKVSSIVCVEPIKEFTKYIVKSDNITVVNQNVFDYKTEQKFDLVTIFGSMHYFNREEAVKVYSTLYSMLGNDGKLIVKNQFGVKEDVIVNGYSEELKKNYYASYRYVESEKSLLEDIGFKNVNVVDIYPPSANRWNNTHFWALVAEI